MTDQPHLHRSPARVSQLRPPIVAAMLALSLGATSMLVMVGCTGNLNTDDQILGADALPALEVAPRGLGEPMDEPSLGVDGATNGWDRRHWERVVVRVPRGQTETNPRGAAAIPVDRELPRQRGEFAVDVEVLDTTSDPGASALDGAVNLAAAPGLMLIGPVVQIVADGRWPWTVVRHPTDGTGFFDRGDRYDRLPPASTRSAWPWLGIEAPDADGRSTTDATAGDRTSAEPLRRE